MSPSLLYLTNQFPFGTGEAFLETEILYLAKEFDHVFVLPVQGMADGPARRMPDNTSVVNIELRNTILRRALRASKMSSAIFSDLMNGSYKGRFRPKAIKRALHNAVMSGNVAEFITDLMKKESIDLIYSFWSNHGAVGAISAIRSSGQNVPFVCRVHGYDLFWERQDPPFVVFQGYVINGSDLYLPDSKNGERYLKEHYPSLAEKITTRYLGTRYMGGCSPSDDGIFRIVSVSSLIGLKRVHLIPQALSLMEGRIEWTHFGDGPERGKVEYLVKDLKLKKEDIEVIMKGNVPNSELLEHYRSKTVDLFLHVSEYEGLPVSIIEALSFSVPVIAADTGGIREIVGERAGCGLLLPHDPTADIIADALRDFMNRQPEELSSERERAYLSWERRVDSDRNFKEFTKELKGLIERRSRV